MFEKGMIFVTKKVAVQTLEPILMKYYWLRHVFFYSIIYAVHVYRVIVYKLVQHYAHTYTVKLSQAECRHVSVAATIIIRADKTTDHPREVWHKQLCVQGRREI